MVWQLSSRYGRCSQVWRLGSKGFGVCCSFLKRVGVSLLLFLDVPGCCIRRQQGSGSGIRGVCFTIKVFEEVC